MAQGLFFCTRVLLERERMKLSTSSGSSVEENYTVGASIGSGHFAEVREVKRNGQTYAWKQFHTKEDME